MLAASMAQDKHTTCTILQYVLSTILHLQLSHSERNLVDKQLNTEKETAALLRLTVVTRAPNKAAMGPVGNFARKNHYRSMNRLKENQ